MLPATGELDFDTIKSEFEKAVANGMNRFSYQLQGVSLTLNKMPDGLWSVAAHNHSGVAGISYGYCRTVNDASNPLFVDGALSPADPTKYVSSYNLKREIYARLVDGASATIELLTPMKFRSFELISYAQSSGYVLPDLDVLVTYADGTTEISLARAYNAGYYLGNAFDQTKAVKTIKLTYNAINAIGQPSMVSGDGAAIFPYNAANIPLLRVSYWYGYQHHFIDERFYPPESSLVDITSQFAITSSTAPSASFPLSNLTDGNDMTQFKPNTNNAALTLTATKITSTPNATPCLIELRLPIDATNGNNTLQSLVFTLGLSTGTGSLASNTRWYRGINNDVVIRAIIGMPNTMREVADRVSVAFSKTSTTQPFAITSLRIFG